MNIFLTPHKYMFKNHAIFAQKISSLQQLQQNTSESSEGFYSYGINIMYYRNLSNLQQNYCKLL